MLVEKNGVRAAIFASVTLPLESWMYLEDQPGMCQATIEDLIKSIASFREKEPATTIIVTLHWGVEYRIVPSATQRQQAKALVRAGADAIVGHHPHVIQSFERIDGKPVFYSVGNLIFDSRDPATHKGILVRFRISAGELKSDFIPYTLENGCPVLLKGERKNKAIEDFQNISDPLPR
ncbi:MAG TPA: CapA family protein [Chryseosolibacter sp.]|nr:CapA family protein [Chryseosolibacter sp.]